LSGVFDALTRRTHSHLDPIADIEDDPGRPRTIVGGAYALDLFRPSFNLL
jgi:hypothetical protein